MSITYKPRKMICRIPGKEKNGYFAGKVAERTIQTNDFCHLVSDRCSLTGSDIKGVIEAIVESIEMELMHGRSIQLGDLGTFSASITSEVVDTEEELKPQKVRIKNITFLPSVRIKESIKKAEFVRFKESNRKT